MMMNYRHITVKEFDTELDGFARRYASMAEDQDILSWDDPWYDAPAAALKNFQNFLKSQIRVDKSQKRD